MLLSAFERPTRSEPDVGALGASQLTILLDGAVCVQLPDALHVHNHPDGFRYASIEHPVCH